MPTIGIDLGTTESVVARLCDGVPVSVRINGSVTTPSVVSYTNGKTVVGRNVVPGDEVNPEDTVFSIKRFIGTNEKICGRSPTEISADILSYLKRSTEEYLAGQITGAVVTVPAHFSDPQRMATRQAAAIAGIKVLRLINEPTAAAIAFGLEKKNSGIFAVYDFGGGTFDFSVLRLVDGIFQVLTTGGDNYLGGDDIDNAVLDYNLQLQGIENLPLNSRISGKLVAKSLKEQLGDLPEIAKNCVLENKNYEFKLSRNVLREVSKNFIQKSLEIADLALRDARLDASALDGVVLVGGMTRLNLIKEAVREHFPIRIFDDISPEEAVAFGAAIYADSITSKSQNMLLIDVVPLTIGLETLGGGVDKIIHRNTPIPIVEKQEYTTHADNQTGIKFHIVQGERPIAAECRSLAHFELIGIPPMPAGRPRIVVEFSVDVNGILSVKAQEQRTNLSQMIDVDPSNGLSGDEMIGMLREAMVHREEDSRQACDINVKIESERMIRLWKIIICEIPDDAKNTAKIELTNLEKALDLGKYEEALVCKKTLEDLFRPFIDNIINRLLSGIVIV
ncbi:MAG: Hsp70 family protein [Holosporaceae bacterium]|jgi:molecular chaperone HscA|nr:Hsp70 family protein [Holosporaceae bacterium]